MQQLVRRIRNRVLRALRKAGKWVDADAAAEGDAGAGDELLPGLAAAAVEGRAALGERAGQRDGRIGRDVYRFTCFLFLPLLFAGLALLQRRGGATMLAVLGAVSVRLMVLQRDTFETIAVKVLTDVDGNGIPFVRPDIVGDIVPKVIPALPWTFAAYGAATVVCVVAGLLWARRTRVVAAQ